MVNMSERYRDRLFLGDFAAQQISYQLCSVRVVLRIRAKRPVRAGKRPFLGPGEVQKIPKTFKTSGVCLNPDASGPAERERTPWWGAGPQP